MDGLNNDDDQILLPSDSGLLPMDDDYDDDEKIVLPRGTTRSTVPGRVQLVIKNNNKAPFEENIQKVMLELTGAEYSRLGLDLVVVLDVSCVMEGERLEELKTAMLFMMKKLGGFDRLSIVKYSQRAKRLCPLRQMTEGSQTELKNLIKDLESSQHWSFETATTDSLRMALNILKDRSVSSGRVGAIMLMSCVGGDISDAAALPVGNVPVHTFGFGLGHYAEGLMVIANNSLGGTYSDVRGSNMTLAFSQCLGGLLSVVAQDLTVTISHIKDESTIKQVSAGCYPQSMDNAAGSVTITFGDIYIQEIRKVFVELHLPSTRKKQDADVLEVSYSYKFDGELFVASPVTVTVCRMSALTAEEQQALPEVREEEVRLLIAEAIKQAITDADDENLERVQHTLANGLLKLEDADIEKLKAELMPELEELLNYTQSPDIYCRHARPFAHSLLISLATQRQTARGNNISKFRLFATPTMQEFLVEAIMLQDSMTFNDDNPIVLFPDSGPEPIVPGKVQLKIINKNMASLEKNIQKVVLEFSGEENSRFGLDVVAVLDVSSSMDGDKLAKMKIAMLILMKTLNSMDCLSIVEYSSKAKRLCPLCEMTESSQTKLANLIDDLKAQPGTNITDGLEMALNVLKDRSVSIGRVGVILLMSDGEQNQGGDAANVPAYNIPVLTFGFGEDQNQEVLIAIANNSGLGGTYVEVCMDDLYLTFSHCLDELQSVAVWDLTVTVTQIENESTVKEVSAGRYVQSIDSAAGSVTITFGTLYIQEVRKVLVELLLTVTKNEHEADVLKVSYTYRNSFDGELCKDNSATLTVRRMSELTAEQQQPQSEVTLVEVHLLIAEVIKQATSVANKEDLKSARDKLVQNLKTLGDEEITQCKTKLQMLTEQLDELSELMQSEAINENQGHSFAYSLLISQFTQRGLERDTTPILNNFKIFATPAMREFLEEAKMYDNVDDLHVYIDRFIGAIQSIEMIIQMIFGEV